MMHFKVSKLWVIVNFYLINRVCEGAKILAVLPTPSISHQTPFRPLFHELARNGHQVTLITTDPAFPKGGAPENITEIDLHDISYNMWKAGFVKLVTGSKNDHMNLLKNTNQIVLELLDAQFQTKEVQSVINGTEEYDLIFLESWITGLLAITQRFNAPVIQLSTLHTLYINSQIFGIPIHPFLYAQPPAQRVYNLTMWEKLDELYKFNIGVDMFEEGVTGQTELMRKYFGKDVPDANELKNRADMLFYISHPIFQGNFPVPPSVISLWGLDKKPEKDLSPDLQKYFDYSKHGVIYFSFGTNTDPANLPPNTIQKFIKVFSELPYDILWKWSQDELPGKPDNVKIGKWFPQTDILRHPKLKLFITQGGLQSTDEAINAGVPLLGIPMLGDQYYNTEKYVHLGIGEKLDIVTFTEEELTNTIDTIIHGSYRKNMQKLRDIMQDEPQPPLQRAVWWVEYVLRHGGARHLRAPAANISWRHYYEVDLVFIVLVAFISVLVVIFYILQGIYSYASKMTVFKSKIKDH